MKKIILTVAAVFVLSFANAQQREKGTIELAPQIGFSISNYTASNININNTPLSGVTFGVGADYFFNNRWSLRSGLHLQQMGSEYSGITDELSYLTVPLNANWHFGSTRKWNLNFGPSIGFLMSAKSGGVDVKSLVTSTQFGFNLGIGYKIEVSEKFSVLIDYQGISGITNVEKNSEISYKNSYNSFNIGGVFKL
jgi:opacity protein-like surface antigen